jgi:hypothetical protein
LFSVLPLVGLPPGLRHEVLSLVSDNAPEAIRYRTHVVTRAGRFSPSGFPVQVSPAGRAGNGLRAHPVPYAVAAVILVLAGSGSAAYALMHKHTTADVHRGATVTITVPARPPTTTALATPAPSPTTASPTPVAVVVTSSPSPTVSPGTLELSAEVVHVPEPVPSPYVPPFTSSFTLTAQGGPVAYSMTVPSSEQPYLTLTPDSGTLQAGQQQVVTVTVTPASSPAPMPRYLNTVTVNPGSISLTIYYTPSG